LGISGRKEKILQAVVDSYINSCEPISSAEIKEHHLPALSTATIRNELAALEEMGYLVQPHTSAGRIPTAEAYRLYVERLMPKRKLTRSELKTVKRYFNRKITELDDILKSTAKVISEITNLTSVAYAQDINDAVIQNIKIVKLTDTTALVIIFQPELRKALEQLGSKNLLTNILPFEGSKPSDDVLTEKTINELVRASVEMGKAKTGALMVIE